MADSIVKLRIDSQEYDAKIKNASQALSKYFDTVKSGGGTLVHLDEGVLDAVKAMGEMETKSGTLKGRIGEMTQAFTELHSRYQQFTNEEKASPIGQEMSKSLDTLKTRIAESKTQLNDVNKELGNTSTAGSSAGSVLEDLAGKFGLNVTQITKFATVAGVATAALQVAKDAFFATEEGIDEWGRTVESAKGAYNVFLDTLNNGTWSNFFQNLATAIQGGRDLYDVFDRLGSIKSNNQAAIAIVQQQIAQLRLAKQQGKNVDDQLKAATQRLAALQKQSINAGKAAGTQSAQTTIRNSVNSMGGAYVSDKSIQAAVGGIMTKGQAEFDKYARTVSRFENWSKAQKKTVQTFTDSQGGTTTRVIKTFDINLLSKEQQRQYKIAKAITDKETDIQQGIAAYAQAVQEDTASAREEFKGNRYALQGSGGKGGSGGSSKGGSTTTKELTEQEKLQKQINELVAEGMTMDEQGRTAQRTKIADLQAQLDTYKEIENELRGIEKKEVKTTPEKPYAVDTFSEAPVSESSISAYMSAIKQGIQQSEVGSDIYNALTEQLNDTSMMSDIIKMAIEGGVKGADLSSAAQELKDALLDGDISEDEIQKILDQINAGIENEEFKIKLTADGSLTTVGKENAKQAKEMTDQWKGAASAVSAVGSAMQQIEDPAAKVIGTVAQAIATVALGYAQATQQASTLGPWAWIAFAATGLATMISTITAIHSATGYAQGGIVKGDSYSGDNVGGLVDGSQLVGLNAGEVVLTRAMAGNLASQLSDSSLSATQGGQPYVTGEMLFLAMNNYGRRTGRGEIVMSRR